MRYLPILFALLIAAPAWGQSSWPAGKVVYSDGDTVEGERDVHRDYAHASLPTCDADAQGTTAYINDGAAAGSCTAGGSAWVLCSCDDNTTWVALGGGAVEVDDLLTTVDATWTFTAPADFDIIVNNSGETGVSAMSLRANNSGTGATTDALNLIMDNEGSGGTMDGLVVQCLPSAADNTCAYGIRVEHQEDVGEMFAAFDARGTSTGAIAHALKVDDPEILSALDIGDNWITTSGGTIQSADFDTVFDNDSSIDDADAQHTHLTAITPPNGASDTRIATTAFVSAKDSYCRQTFTTEEAGDIMMCGRVQPGWLTDSEISSLHCVALGAIVADVILEIVECDSNGASCVGSGFSVEMDIIEITEVEAVGVDRDLDPSDWWGIQLVSFTTMPDFVHCQVYYRQGAG